MKKSIVIMVIVLLLPVFVTAFFDDMLKNTVGNAVHDAVKDTIKDVKNEVIKSIDEELAEVLSQKCTELTPEEIVGMLKANLKNGLDRQDFMFNTNITSDTKKGKAAKKDDSISWTVQSYNSNILAYGKQGSKTDDEWWAGYVKDAKQYGDINNTVIRGITDWSPYALRPYIITIVSAGSGTTLTASMYEKTLEILRETLPDIKKIPQSAWLIQ